jgi:hypothetical protein
MVLTPPDREQENMDEDPSETPDGSVSEDAGFDFLSTGTSLGEDTPDRATGLTDY